MCSLLNRRMIDYKVPPDRKNFEPHTQIKKLKKVLEISFSSDDLKKISITGGKSNNFSNKLKFICKVPSVYPDHNDPLMSVFSPVREKRFAYEEINCEVKIFDG